MIHERTSREQMSDDRTNSRLAGSDPAADPPPLSRASLIARQIGIVFLGFLLAAVMVGLGVWQLHVYNEQGHKQAEARAAAPAVALESVARPGRQVSDEAYARQVRFTGSYDQRLQTLVPTGSNDRYRVVTGLRVPGGILPVVRGMVTGRQAPPPPTGQVTETGILMPSEGSNANPAEPSAQPTTVVLPQLAQRWNGQLINGFATLTAAESQAQSLQPVTVELPSSHGRLQNGFYAVQWWVFAAFAIWMGVRMARDWGRNPDGLMGGDDELPYGSLEPTSSGSSAGSSAGSSLPTEAAMSSRAGSDRPDSAPGESTT